MKYMKLKNIIKRITPIYSHNKIYYNLLFSQTLFNVLKL